jgi:hypothetical protein
MANRRKPPAPREGSVFVTEYRHWRTGKLMKASDYGLKAFCFPSKGKRK